MQTNLETSFNSSVENHLPGTDPNIFRDTENARSQSRSTDGTDTTDGNQSDLGGIESDGSPTPPPIATNINMALQQVTNTTVNEQAPNPFPQFNQADLLNFHNNPLLPHQMFSNFGRYSQFDQKPDVGVLQQQMQMREAKPYKCTQCVKAFANSSYLSQHMRIHLGIKPFGPCNYCGKKFTQLSHLQQHIRTHTGEKPYKCKFSNCDKAFSQLSNLQSHSRCHQTDKPYKCNSCYKCFADEQTLLDHIPKHKESKHLKRLKVHICPFCGKSYTQQTYLQKHMAKHTDKTAKQVHSFANEVQADHFDSQILAWNSMQGMNEASGHDASSFNAINPFASNSMIGSVSGSQATPYQNSAFTQLLNFQYKNNSRYLPEYQTTKQNGERAAGFNMIPLENIQRYNGTNATAATVNTTTPAAVAAAAAAAATVPTNGSTSSTSTPPTPQQQFNPQSIINTMKNQY